MKAKNMNTDLCKKYIMEALLILLKNKSFSEISIKEITTKAGVNRSTYYRNFSSKEDIIKYFYSYLLFDCISDTSLQTMEDHLTTIFDIFYKNKKDLLCLHKNNLSYLLLDTLNSFFIKHNQLHASNFSRSFEVYYHAGGVFNTFLLWFDHEMKLSPLHLVKKSMQILPNDFKPALLLK